ncbi:MAG: HEPN domain-containing protein [Pyrinomonadaceae bacterium]
MNPITIEWVSKAEGDFATSQRELKVQADPNYDAGCFHAQQCAEKYLKARLQESGIAFGKTHDLSMLLDMTLTIEPTWDILLRTDLQTLSAFAVAYRYPGDSADETEAREAVQRCQSIRQIIRQSLAL